MFLYFTTKNHFLHFSSIVAQY